MPFEAAPGLDQPRDKSAIARAFSRSAGDYDRVARLQQATGERLLASLGSADIDTSVDLGTGTGHFLPGLACRSRQLLALDLACGMLSHARDHRAVSAAFVAADAEQLPLAGNSVDLIFSNLVLQWTRLPRVLQEAARVLRPGGRLHFTTLLSDTLFELRDSWAMLDDHPHVNRFESRSQTARDLAQSPLHCCQVDYRIHRLHYRSTLHLMRELKGVGATHVPGRRGGVTRSTLLHLEQSYRQRFAEGDLLPASWDVAYVVMEKPA